MKQIMLLILMTIAFAFATYPSASRLANAQDLCEYTLPIVAFACVHDEGVDCPEECRGAGIFRDVSDNPECADIQLANLSGFASCCRLVCGGTVLQIFP